MSDSPYQGRYRETERRAFGQDSYDQRDGGAYRQDAGQVLQTLDQDMLAFRGCIQSIGTQFDSGDNRKEIRRLRSVIKKKIGDSEGGLKSMHGRSRAGAQKIQFERMSKQLDSHVSTFQQLLQQEKKVTQQHPSAPGWDTEPADRGISPHGVPPSYSQTQTQVQMSQVERREQEQEELQDLERDIQDLQGIHQELAGMVEVQGETVNTIETQVVQAGDRVVHGNQELGQAVVLKRKNRKIQCCLAIYITTVVIIVLVLVIVLPITLTN